MHIRHSFDSECRDFVPAPTLCWREFEFGKQYTLGEQEGIACGLRRRLAIRYAIEGDLRFLSHQDSLRFFQRAIARAGISIRYSEGFNPRPRISIAMPRPVGVASRDERLVVELTADTEPGEVAALLAAQVPGGIRILDAVRLNLQDRCTPVEAEYEVPLAEEDALWVSSRVAEFMAQPNVVVERPVAVGQRKKMIDIRAFLIEMRVAGGKLVWRQVVSQDGTARIGEVLNAIGLPSREWTHKVIRSAAVFRN